MKAFVDLPGASGAQYRFRLWPEGAAHPPIAGNYACLQFEGEAYAVLAVGETLDLSRLGSELPKRLREAKPVIYTRLNVAREVRQAEHHDITAGVKGSKARVRAA